MAIPAGTTLECDRLTVSGVPNPAALTHDTGDKAVGTVFVSGTFIIHGCNLPLTNQSFWDSGTLEIDTSGNPGLGRVKLDGGRFTYSGGDIDTINNGGDIDTINNDGGFFCAYNSGELKLTAGAGKIGACLYVGWDDVSGTMSPATLTFQPLQSGNIYFYKDATIYVSAQGTANLSSGGIKLWNFGGPGAGYGSFQNWGGAANVVGNLNSEMYFQNTSTGVVDISGSQTLNITGFKALADLTRASFVNSLPATTRLEPNATLKLTYRYYQEGGTFECNDSNTANGNFNVTGNMDIAGGTVLMGSQMDHYGALNVSGYLLMRGTSVLSIDVSGTSAASDVVNTGSTTLEDGCTLRVFTTGVPPLLDPPERRTFVTTTDGVSGSWNAAIDEHGDYFNWTMDSSQCTLLATGGPGGGGGGG